MLTIMSDVRFGTLLSNRIEGLASSFAIHCPFHAKAMKDRLTRLKNSGTARMSSFLWSLSANAELLPT